MHTRKSLLILDHQHHLSLRKFGSPKAYRKPVEVIGNGGWKNPRFYTSSSDCIVFLFPLMHNYIAAVMGIAILCFSFVMFFFIFLFRFVSGKICVTESVCYSLIFIMSYNFTPDKERL